MNGVGAPIARVSVALITRNRPKLLRGCLASWRSQSVQPFEIVVSDDSDDSTRPEVKEIAAEFETRWVPGPRRGLYANRNLAAARCGGTHVLSADDDHEHPVDLLEKCQSAIESDAAAVWCLGEVHRWTDIDK